MAYLSAIAPEEIIALTNEERAAAGLSALTANQLLTQAAIAKGKAILESQTFKHNIDDKKFSSWIRDAGYNYSYAGENLAIDFTTGQSIIEAWKNSPLHKKNLLSPYYKEIGVSAIQGKFQGQSTTIVVQIFGSPAVGSAQPLSLNSGLDYINSNINFSENNLAGYRLAGAEDLLTHSILNQELTLADDNKLILPSENNITAEVNNFIIQPKFLAAANNFLIIFTSLTLIYLLIFLYYYYFFKINRLASV
ncbi:CAP domain-containing protein [Candidatus Falkowbacteria bacterium]|nr:CAP domain-containing protein [Candidatus Falkowbacteria bacterium]